MTLLEDTTWDVEAASEKFFEGKLIAMKAEKERKLMESKLARDETNQVVAATGATPEQAVDILDRHNWNAEAASEAYFVERLAAIKNRKERIHAEPESKIEANLEAEVPLMKDRSDTDLDHE